VMVDNEGVKVMKKLMAIVGGIPIGISVAILSSVPFVAEPSKLPFVFMGLASAGLGFGIFGLSTKLEKPASRLSS
jgi:formate-dependent nitrite reductase membrane component NrfD